MNPLIEQFPSESRESLEGIGEKLMQMEKDPTSSELMTELFRFVQTMDELLINCRLLLGEVHS